MTRPVGPTAPLNVFRRWVHVLLLLATGFQQAGAFSLLGPYAPWMDVRKGYRLPGDTGGPMNVSEEYRWNIPVITYGFDQSFVSYFGSNGVAAVEEAIRMLNDLPAASLLNPDAYPMDSRANNQAATALGAIDLKSTALTLLLHHIGLSESERHVWVLRAISVITNGSYSITNYAVARRSFDPLTAQPSDTVNGALYTYHIIDPNGFINGTAVADAVELRADTLTPAGPNSVAGGYPGYGLYYTNLTRDDVGGIRYLLARENVNAETLPAGVMAVGPIPSGFVNAALRPGVEKLTFVRVPYDSLLEMAPPFTNVFTDTFFSNGIAAQQTLQRIVNRPDLLISASELSLSLNGFALPYEMTVPEWQNNAILNGDPDGAGPGVIQPGGRITFNKVGPVRVNTAPWFLDETTAIWDFTWASFNDGPPVLYPAGTPLPANRTILVGVEDGEAGREFRWRLWGTLNKNYQFESSTNLIDWVGVTNLYNNSGLLDFRQAIPGGRARMFYRLLEQ